MASPSPVASLFAVVDLLGELVALLQEAAEISELLELEVDAVAGASVGPVWYVGEAVDDDSLSLSDLVDGVDDAWPFLLSPPSPPLSRRWASGVLRPPAAPAAPAVGVDGRRRSRR